MKNLASLLGIIVLLFLVNVSTFTVQETEQAIILQLGKVKGDPVTQAGLHWKLPFVQDVTYFDKRILHWDGDVSEIPTRDKKFILVDTTARWKINDALLFYRSVKNIDKARDRMGSIIDGAAKDTISSYALIESVRNANKILDDIAENRRTAEEERDTTEVQESDTVLDEFVSDMKRVTKGREKLSLMIAERARKSLKDLGIDLIDIQLRRIAYQEKVEKSVFQSMISERNQIATKIRSAGKGEEARILGQLDLSLKRIESEAYRKSQAIKGEADAQAIKIFADALREDPKFYEFVKNLEVYQKTLSQKGEFILTTDNAFLKLLQNGG